MPLIKPQAQVQLPPKDDIQRQQADLQAKILSLLGSNAVVPSSSQSRPGYDSSSANGDGAGGFRTGGGMSGGRGYGHGGFSSGF